MSATPGQFVRRQLGRRMRSLREEAGKSALDVEESEICSRMTLYRIENGKQATPYGTVLALCGFYGADGVTTKALGALARATKGRGWAEDYGDVVPATLGLYLGCELVASGIRMYDPTLVPGQLQTTDYAHAVFAGERLDAPEEYLDRLVEARRKRQEQFWAKRPPGAIFCAVIDQAALSRLVGSRATMRHQLDELRRFGGQDGVDIRVLRWEAGAHPGIYGGFTIFDFPDVEDPTVVYAENYTGGRYLEDEASVGRILNIQRRIHQMSVPIKECV